MRSPEWIGNPMADALGWQIAGDAYKKERTRIKVLIADWLKDGALIGFDERDRKRTRRAYSKIAPVRPTN
jgi:hypothetical protein